MNLAQTKTKTTTDFEKEVKTLLLCLVNRSDVVKRNFDLVLQELNTLQTNSLNQSSVIEKLLKTRTCSMDCTSETKTGETKPYPESESDSDYEDEPVPKRIVINRPNKYGKNYKEESDSDDETYVEN